MRSKPILFALLAALMFYSCSRPEDAPVANELSEAQLYARLHENPDFAQFVTSVHAHTQELASLNEAALASLADSEQQMLDEMQHTYTDYSHFQATGTAAEKDLVKGLYPAGEFTGAVHLDKAKMALQEFKYSNADFLKVAKLLTDEQGPQLRTNSVDCNAICDGFWYSVWLEEYEKGTPSDEAVQIANNARIGCMFACAILAP